MIGGMGKPARPFCARLLPLPRARRRILCKKKFLPSSIVLFGSGYFFTPKGLLVEGSGLPPIPIPPIGVHGGSVPTMGAALPGLNGAVCFPVSAEPKAEIATATESS